MKFWRYGLFGSILVCSVWTAFWHLIITIISIIATGKSLLIQLSPSVLAGALMGVIIFLLRFKNMTLRNIIGITTLTMLIWAFTMFAPLYTDSRLVEWQRGLLLLIQAIFTWFCITNIVKDTKAGFQSHYASERLYLRFLWGLGLALFILIVIGPFYVMVITSLKSQQSLFANPLDLAISLDVGADALFRSYIELFTKYNFGTLLLNSTIVSIVTVIITLLFSVPGAYAVARLRFPARKWLSASVLMIYLIPAIILVVPLYALFSQIGLRNSLVGLCIVYPATTIPVALYMLRGYFAGLPSELDDAGLMDGLTRLQIIIRISMPLSMPAITSVALYVFMIAWNEFLFAFMFLDDVKLFTLSRGIVSLNSSEVPRQHLMAGSVIATVPVLIIFLWLQRFLVSGLTSGSVKG